MKSQKNKSYEKQLNLFKEDEEIPKDNEGNLMLPLFQLCLDNIENIPKILSDTQVLTVFVTEELPMDLAENGKNWIIREYKKSDNLTIKELTNPNSFIKPFPLSPQIVEEDYPVWDGGTPTAESRFEVPCPSDRNALRNPPRQHVPTVRHNKHNS